ncbi:hypothetical protein ABZ820_38940 [Streptomyces diacarni]|uniref:hypothetical protein n=1 Tax=Streptomyces diacarni TaxID=2800381 RepID=UPI0033C95911
MCPAPQPDSRDADAERHVCTAVRGRTRTVEPGDSASPAGRWYLRENTSWGSGLRVAFGILDALATLTQHEALALVARALRAVVSSIVDAGQHRRS